MSWTVWWGEFRSVSVVKDLQQHEKAFTPHLSLHLCIFAALNGFISSNRIWDKEIKMKLKTLFVRSWQTVLQHLYLFCEKLTHHWKPPSSLFLMLKSWMLTLSEAFSSLRCLSGSFSATSRMSCGSLFWPTFTGLPDPEKWLGNSFMNWFFFYTPQVFIHLFHELQIFIPV